MRVSGYISPLSRLAKPTGVGQHAVYMFEHLATRIGKEFSLLTSRREYDTAKDSLSTNVRDCPVDYYSGSERVRRMLSVGVGAGAIDRVAKLTANDWVYCPKEQPVAVRKARLAVTVHDVRAFEPQIIGLPGRHSWQQRLQRNRIMSRIIRRADLILTVSEFTTCRLEELFHVPRSRCVVVGNGVSPVYSQKPTDADELVLDHFSVRPRHYFVSVGSLTRRKGGDLLLELAQQMSNSDLNDYPIIVTGRRHDPDLLQRYREILGDNPTLPLQLVGYIDDADQAALLRRSAALLFPTRYEGFGIPVLEAMATGTRVICSDQAAVQEVAAGFAITVPMNDRRALLQAAEHVIDEPEERRQSAIYSARKHAEKFTWVSCGERLFAALCRN